MKYLIALIKDVAVEMIAAKIAQATRAVIEGFVIFSITVIKTLDPFGMTRPRFFAKTPKKTGLIDDLTHCLKLLSLSK